MYEIALFTFVFSIWLIPLGLCLVLLKLDKKYVNKFNNINNGYKIYDYSLDYYTEKYLYNEEFGSNVIGVSILPVANFILSMHILYIILNNLDSLKYLKKKIKNTEKDRKLKQIIAKFKYYANMLEYSYSYDKISNIIFLFNSITQQSLYKEMAINRLEYAVTLLSEYEKNNSIKLNVINIIKIFDTTLDFFNELQKQINEKDRKIAIETNNYLQQKLDNYINTTNEMKKGLVKVRKIEDK